MRIRKGIDKRYGKRERERRGGRRKEELGPWKKMA